jgi:hypothetical protein
VGDTARDRVVYGLRDRAQARVELPAVQIACRPA